MTDKQWDKLNIGDSVTKYNGPNKNVIMKVTEKYISDNTFCITAYGVEPNSVYNQQNHNRSKNFTSGAASCFKLINEKNESVKKMVRKGMTVNDINKEIEKINKAGVDFDADNISDGYHTFGQLYFQRMMLFATIVNLFPEISWKTKRHEDGEECFGGGWFLVTIETPAGAYGYHYEEKYWDIFKCDELDKAKPWDGYTEENADRLFSLTAYSSLIQFVNKQYFTKHETKECPFCKGTGMSTPFTPENKCGYCDGKGVIEND